MNSLERFYATLERREGDHPAPWLGMPDPASLPGLLREYGVNSLHALKHAVGEDIYAVEPPTTPRRPGRFTPPLTGTARARWTPATAP